MFDRERLKVWVFALGILGTWAGLMLALLSIPGVPKLAAFLLMCYPATLALGAFAGSSYFRRDRFGTAHSTFATLLILYVIAAAVNPVGGLAAAGFAAIGARGGYALLRDEERRRVRASLAGPDEADGAG